VEAPVALFTTVSTVPNGSVGLAQYPAGAAEYHVASPPSLFVAAGGGGGAVVVVVVGGGGGCVVGGGGGSVVVVVGGAVVVVAGAVVDVVGGAWYATRFDGRFTPSACADGCTTFFFSLSCALLAAADDRDVCADALCNSKRGAPNKRPQMTAAMPRRLPPVLWFRRAPPFIWDAVHPRRRTGGERFLENLDNQSRDAQTSIRTKPFRALFSQVMDTAVRDI
jgi:hypothetical protein